MPQDQPAVIGKDAIRSLYESVLKEFHVTSKGTLKEVEASGDWGYFWSTYTLTATPKAGGKPIKSSGKSVFIVKRSPAGPGRSHGSSTTAMVRWLIRTTTDGQRV
jgi:ketosteroid isomerase-like protein